MRAISQIDTTPRRVRLLLPVLLVVTLSYPLAELNSAAAIAYGLGYIAVLGLGARVASVTRRRTVVATAIAGGTALLVVPWTLRPDVLWLSLSFEALLVVFHVLVMVVVGTYMIEAPEIDIDVIFAGTSLYVLAGNLFVPAGLLVDALTVEATGASAYTSGPLAWSDMTYFSFTTLTTLGYGDVTPATTSAQALAIAEAVLGTLILALIIGRLVGAAPGKLRHRLQDDRTDE